MKNYIFGGLLTLLSASSTDAQQPVDVNNPMELEKMKDDLEHIRTSVERTNTGPTLSNSSTLKENSKLDQLIGSLHPVENPTFNTSPLNGSVAPKGIYNTSDTSKILIDEEVFNERKNSNQNMSANESNLSIIIVVMGICIMGLIGFIVIKYRK